ncbi:MAG: DEAD/DEAH box helicase [Methylococcaceae bacterium]
MSIETTDTVISANFANLNLAEPLLRAIKKQGYIQPTPVQQHAIPAALTGQDLLVSAETGSGKTAAFLLPALQYLLDNPSSLFGTRVLILTPTRELAQQVYQQALKLADFTTIRIGLITGGEDFKQQQSAIRRNVALLIATPGRLIELIEQDAPDFSQLDCLILDEADRMLDMGFSDAVLSIVERCTNNRQTLLFSATLNHHGVLKMASKVLDDYETVSLNTLQDSHSQIEQQLILADDNEHKQKLLAWLLENETYEKALVFTNMKSRAEDLREPLRAKGLRVGVLHGDMDQKDRKRTMELFHDGVITIVVATDLAARGLDIKGIDLVINYDVPRNGIDYIHRIGRTGRAEESGRAIVLVKHTEWNVVSGIQRFLKQEFTKRTIKELIGSYKGPKKTKSSGKAVGVKAKEEPKKPEKPKIKIRERDKKNIGKRRVPKNKQFSEDTVIVADTVIQETE